MGRGWFADQVGTETVEVRREAGQKHRPMLEVGRLLWRELVRELGRSERELGTALFRSDVFFFLFSCVNFFVGRQNPNGLYKGNICGVLGSPCGARDRFYQRWTSG